MTPLLPGGPALDLGCTPPAIQSPTTLPSPGAPMTPLLAAATALGLGAPRVPSTITLPCSRSTQ
jgi:hypothetical protein